MGVVAVGAVTLEVPPITMRGAVGTCRWSGGPAFFDPIAWDSSDFAPGRARDINQRALNNLIKQGVLAFCIWPAAGFWLCGKLLSDGDGVVMGCSGAVFPLSFGLVI